MYKYNRVLVALNLLSDQDETTLRYAGMLSRLGMPNTIYIAHVAETLDLPDAVREAYPQAMRPVDETIEAELQHRVATTFGELPAGAEIQYLVGEGTTAETLLRWTRLKDIDLVIVGSKRRDRDGGSTPEKMARRAPCSVLSIPDGAAPRITRILVPIDFSEHSMDALTKAIAIAAAAGHTELVCLHVFNVPLGYYKIGKTYEEFAAIMRLHAEEKYRQFIEGVDRMGLDFVPLFEPSERPARRIPEIAERERADLILMGARGRSNSAAVMLGSVTERVLLNASIPVIAVKQKGEEANMGFLEALLEL
ncbi:MAG: universal stress protein [Rhodothermales bacterium]